MFFGRYSTIEKLFEIISKIKNVSMKAARSVLCDIVAELLVLRGVDCTSK